MQLPRAGWPCVLAMIVGFVPAISPRAAFGLGEETIGNTPLSDANYTSWPGIMPLVNDTHRVYHSWVNGHECFYYQGDERALNAALEAFSRLDVERRELAVVPGAKVVKSFDGARRFTAVWHVQLMGGISAHLTTVDRGALVWPRHPRLTICVTESLDLAKLKIPSNIHVVGLETLKTRCREAIAESTDRSVRGWGLGTLAGLDAHDPRSLEFLLERLGDEDAWVRLNAAGAVSNFGALARPKLELLKELHAKEADERTKTSLDGTIVAIEAAKVDEKAEAAFKTQRERAAGFAKMPPYFDAQK